MGNDQSADSNTAPPRAKTKTLEKSRSYSSSSKRPLAPTKADASDTIEVRKQNSTGNLKKQSSTKEKLRRPKSATNVPMANNPNASQRTQIANKGRRLFSDFHDAQADYAKRWGETQKGLEGITKLFVKEAPKLAEKYEIVSPEACGVTAVVCKGINRETNEVVAVKFVRIRVPGLSDTIRRKDCEEEARLQQLCDHRNVVKLIDFQMGTSFALYILEYVSSTLLEKIVERNSNVTYSERTAAAYMKDVASALRHCHSQGVCHMDVKLDNILCSENNEAKLCDFGVAEQMQFANTPIQRSVAAPLFAPAEVYTSGYCTTQADMWSLGVVLYILLCGYPPFKETDLKPRIIKARYTFPERDWASVSIMARDLISRLLVLDIRKRYTAQQVLSHPWIKAVAKIPRPRKLKKPTKEKVAVVEEEQVLPKKEPSVIDSQKSAGSESTKSCTSTEDEEGKDPTAKFVPLPLRVTKFLRNMHHYRQLEKRGFDSIPGGQLYRSLLDGVDEITTGMAKASTAGTGNESASWLTKKINKTLSIQSDMDSKAKEQESNGANPTEESFLPKLVEHFESYYFPDEDRDDYYASVSLKSKPDFPISRRTGSIKEEEATEDVSAEGSAAAAAAATNLTGKDIYAVTRMRSRRGSSSASATLPVEGGVMPPKQGRITREKSFDIHPEAPPTWIDDDEAVTCRICDSHFTLVRRRHHCRLCGNVTCADCAHTRLSLKILSSNQQVRVCNLCAAHYK